METVVPMMTGVTITAGVKPVITTTPSTTQKVVANTAQPITRVAVARKIVRSVTVGAR